MTLKQGICTEKTEMEISRIAYQHFYESINYPNLLPHKEEEHNRKYYNRIYKYNFDDYSDEYDLLDSQL